MCHGGSGLGKGVCVVCWKVWKLVVGVRMKSCATKVGWKMGGSSGWNYAQMGQGDSFFARFALWRLKGSL